MGWQEEQGRAGEAPGPEVPVVTREIAAEAAVWIARLHGPERSKRMARECQAWQARSAAHRLAFERGTDLWMEAAGVDRAAVARAATSAAAASAPKNAAGVGRIKSWPAAALGTILLVCALVLGPWWGTEAYDTGVGEQRIVMLQDGTRMSLNTSTRVRADLGRSRRTVDVVSGEALFEVAKDASRPFVVRAAGAEVTATGTAFAVRYLPASGGGRDEVGITLVEGRVVVRGAGRGESSTADLPVVEMSAGERLRVAGRSQGRMGEVLKPQVDRPRVDQVLAWRRGEAIFDNVSLADAVAEMNRYSAMPISLVDMPEPSNLRVSGVYRTGDNASFAHAVASLHGLVVRERADRLDLALKQGVQVP